MMGGSSFLPKLLQDRRRKQHEKLGAKMVSSGRNIFELLSYFIIFFPPSFPFFGLIIPLVQVVLSRSTLKGNGMVHGLAVLKFVPVKLDQIKD